MAETLTAEDSRYREMFDMAREAASFGDVVLGDVVEQMCVLRDQAPVMKGSLHELLAIKSNHASFDRPREHYTFLSFEFCDRAFRDNQLFSSEAYKESPGVRSLGNVILAMIGEEHRRYRGAVQPMFLRRKAMTWWQQNWIDEAVEALLERFNGRAAADLNEELCARLPVHVVTRGIGMSGDDALTFREQLMRGTVGSRGLSIAEKTHALGEVNRMLKALIVARRAQPGDDVVSGLIQCELQLPDGSSGTLTDEEIFAYCRLIMLAGGGTTWRQLGITLDALLTNYHFWEACRDDRRLLEPAIEESLRWRPTDPTFPRLITQDIEIGGVAIPAGARVDLCLGAANRDPTRWDNPNVYDLFRPAKYHLGFGVGPHLCLGMNVARQEMITALNGLMDRFPKMHLDPNAPAPQVVGGLEQRGVSAVPVRFR
jgi:cytochrome P450